MVEIKYTEIQIGNYVKLNDLSGSPLPKLMRNSIQKVIGLRDNLGINEAHIERYHRGRRVQCWIPILFVAKVLSYEEAYPASACPRFSPHRPGSALESFSRQRCLPCSVKIQCPYFQSNHRQLK